METYPHFLYNMETKLKELIDKLDGYKYTSHPSKNLYIEYYSNGSVCKSYNAIIGFFINKEGYYFTRFHNYSKTTQKHCKQWCGMSASDRDKMIKSNPSRFISDYD